MTCSSFPDSPGSADRNPEARTARGLARHPASTAVLLLLLLVPGVAAVRAEEPPGAAGVAAPILAGPLPSAPEFLRREDGAIGDMLLDLTLDALDARPVEELTDEALLGLAILRSENGDYGGAAEAARALLEREPEGSLAAAGANVLGFAFLHRGSLLPDLLGESITAFRRAVELSGGQSLPARYGLALALWRTDRQADAIEVARTTLRETPHGPLADRMRILHCTVFGHTRDAADASHDGSEEGAEVGLSELNAEQQQQMEENPDAIRAPEKIFSPAPPYTEAARRERVQGHVVVEAIIDRYGCIRHTKVIESLTPGLDRNAAAAIRTWVFRPAELAGEPVQVYYRLHTNFRLR